MKISKVGLDLIKSFEGCYLKAYRCPAGVLTIGWGCTVGVKEGQVITQEQADQMLMNELLKFESAVNKYVTYKINQNQFDALVSFAYNCGTGALQKSELLRLINQGKVKEASDQFLLWNKVTVTENGKTFKKELKGLTRRRVAEKDLFLKEEEYMKKATRVVVNGIEKTVQAIEKDDTNHMSLREIAILSGGHMVVDYDTVNKIPVITFK